MTADVYGTPAYWERIKRESIKFARDRAGHVHEMEPFVIQPATVGGVPLDGERCKTCPWWTTAPSRSWGDMGVGSPPVVWVR